MSFFESDRNGRCDNKACSCRPKVDVKETIKVSDIVDPLGNLRYKVALVSFDPIKDERYELNYRVQVINFFSTLKPLIIIDRPNEDELPIFDYYYALGLYNEYVKTYTALVRAETRDFQDIEVYKEKIGYKKTLPACCATCKWSRRKVTPGQFIYEDTGKLECTHPENCFKYANDLNDFDYTNRHCRDHWHQRQHQCDCQHMFLYPNVDPFGICEHYLLKMRPQVPVPGQSITQFIDMRLGERLDTKIKGIAEEVISVGLTSDLSAPVYQAVSIVLSSPESSAILSSPVVLIFNSTLSIKDSTIQLVGNAISTDVLLKPVANAISSAFTNVETSAMLDSPLAGMLSAPETSAAIVKAAEEGIRVTEIRGGKEFKDADGDGKPDAYSSLVIGDLGA